MPPTPVGMEIMPPQLPPDGSSQDTLPPALPQAGPTPYGGRRVAA